MNLFEWSLILAAVVVPFNWLIAGAVSLLYARTPAADRSVAMRRSAAGLIAVAVVSSILATIAGLRALGFVPDPTFQDSSRIVLLILLAIPSALWLVAFLRRPPAA